MLGSLRATAGGNATPIVNSTQAITAASTIAITSGVANQVCPVTSATAITLASNPQLATGIAGQRVTIQNNGGFTITFADANGLSLQGTLVIGSTQFATFVNLGGFWQLENTSGSPVWTPFVFQNGWGNVGGYQACEYTKFLATVSIRGFISRSGTVVSGTPITITQLPVGFRSPGLVRLPTEADFQMLTLNSDGVIAYLTFMASAPNPQFVGFTPIVYRV